MMKTIVKIELISEHAKLPKLATKHSAGADLYAANVTPLVVEPLSRVLIPLGFKMQLPVGYEAQIRPRSGLAFKKGITIANAPGTIDADYRGEVMVMLINLSETDFEVNKGDRIAQMVIAEVPSIDYISVDGLDSTERGAGGFGSTGI